MNYILSLMALKKKIINEKIYLDGVINKEHSTIKEILSFLKKLIVGQLVMSICIYQTQLKENGLEIELKRSDDHINFTKNGKEAILNKLNSS